MPITSIRNSIRSAINYRKIVKWKLIHQARYNVNDGYADNNIYVEYIIFNKSISIGAHYYNSNI